MDELKECPFCGGIGLMKSGPHDDYDVEYWVQCHSCAAQGGWMKNKSGAIHMWNSRHLTQQCNGQRVPGDFIEEDFEMYYPED